MKIKNKIIIIAFTALVFINGNKLVFALSSQSNHLTRAEVVTDVVNVFDLKNKHAAFILKCLEQPNDCFFVFSAMSGFDQIGFSPLRLYPDVSYASTYADDVHVATMLGIVRGYLGEKNMPFKPNANMSRIEALKVVLAAADLVEWKERFELVMAAGSEAAFKNQEAVFEDITPGAKDVWWYDRYARFALKEGIIDHTAKFNPNDTITSEDLQEMMSRSKVAQAKKGSQVGQTEQIVQ